MLTYEAPQKVDRYIEYEQRVKNNSIHKPATTMHKHALKIGVFAVALYLLCLLWKFTMTDPAVMNLHLLSLKSLFPGFSGYDAFSLLWGAILAFVYAYLASTAFHALHSDCCIQRNNQKDEKNKCLWDDKHIILVVAMLAIGVLIGFILSQSETPYMKRSFRDSTFMMRDGGSSMMQMGRMMMGKGRMMNERGEKYSDQEMMQKGKEMMDSGQIFERQGSSMMERGDAAKGMMGGGSEKE